jgi:hypothetical protein
MDPDADPVEQLAHQTVRHLTEDGDGVPDARAAVQDILGQYCVYFCFISVLRIRNPDPRIHASD